MRNVDVVIVGGGMVGACLATALSRFDLSITVLEAFPLGHEQQPSFDDRSVAVSYGSVMLLQQLGLWQRLSTHASPIKQIQVSEKGRFGLTRMDATQENVPALGYVLENKWIGEVLGESVDQAANIEWIAPATVENVNTLANCVEVTYCQDDTQHTLKATLLIAADGAQSSVRSSVGVMADEKDYGISAIVANVQTQLDHKGVAYERFTSSGPLAFLPLNDFENQHRCSVVLSLKHHELTEWEALSDSAFLSALQARFGQRLGRLLHVGRRQSYPVALTQARQCISQRTILLGNAAQAVNPVAGQGFNLAMRDIATLVSVLTKHLATSRDLGNKELLDRYAAQRQGDRTRTVLFTDGLITLFSNDLTWLSHLRAGGLMLTDLIPVAREQFVRQGMGLSAKRVIGRG